MAVTAAGRAAAAMATVAAVRVAAGAGKRDPDMDSRSGELAFQETGRACRTASGKRRTRLQC